jgi:hypothetical protein
MTQEASSADWWASLAHTGGAIGRAGSALVCCSALLGSRRLQAAASKPWLQAEEPRTRREENSE